MTQLFETTEPRVFCTQKDESHFNQLSCSKVQKSSEKIQPARHLLVNSSRARPRTLHDSSSPRCSWSTEVQSMSSERSSADFEKSVKLKPIETQSTQNTPRNRLKQTQKRLKTPINNYNTSINHIKGASKNDSHFFLTLTFPLAVLNAHCPVPFGLPLVPPGLRLVCAWSITLSLHWSAPGLRLVYNLVLALVCAWSAPGL